MRTDTCQCGQTLFFDNHQCIRCQSPVGWCAKCRRMAALLPTQDGHYRCHHPDCETILDRCYNYEVHQVCNWTVLVPAEETYCESCRLTDVIPNPEDATLWERWQQMEMAKRRVLYTLDLLALPYRRDDSAATPPLRFQFLSEKAAKEPIVTGHQNGCITINLKEADDVEREKTRVAFNEPQRTLVGHCRHEIGHYYWDVLVKGKDEDAFRSLFGDERSPSYPEAQQTYYQNGPIPDWQSTYISAYASMHPWEDFAETFSGYLDVTSLLDTASHHSLINAIPTSFPKKISDYQQLAIIMNEMTRERGLLDQVPEVLNATVVEKLQYLHNLINR